MFGDMLDMLVPLTIVAGNSVLRRRDDDIDLASESACQAIRNARAIIGAVCQKPTDLCVDTIEETWQRGLVANVFGR